MHGHAPCAQASWHLTYCSTSSVPRRRHERSVAGWTLQSGVWGSAARRVGSVISSWLALIVVVDYAPIAVAAQVQLDLLSLLS